MLDAYGRVQRVNHEVRVYDGRTWKNPTGETLWSEKFANFTSGDSYALVEKAESAIKSAINVWDRGESTRFAEAYWRVYVSLRYIPGSLFMSFCVCSIQYVIIMGIR